VADPADGTNKGTRLFTFLYDEFWKAFENLGVLNDQHRHFFIVSYYVT
jgi:hypothetical protein